MSGSFVPWTTSFTSPNPDTLSPCLSLYVTCVQGPINTLSFGQIGLTFWSPDILDGHLFFLKDLNDHKTFTTFLDQITTVFPSVKFCFIFPLNIKLTHPIYCFSTWFFVYLCIFHWKYLSLMTNVSTSYLSEMTKSFYVRWTSVSFLTNWYQCFVQHLHFVLSHYFLGFYFCSHSLCFKNRPFHFSLTNITSFLTLNVINFNVYIIHVTTDHYIK